MKRNDIVTHSDFPDEKYRIVATHGQWVELSYCNTKTNYLDEDLYHLVTYPYCLTTKDNLTVIHKPVITFTISKFNLISWNDKMKLISKKIKTNDVSVFEKYMIYRGFKDKDNKYVTVKKTLHTIRQMKKANKAEFKSMIRYDLEQMRKNM